MLLNQSHSEYVFFFSHLETQFQFYFIAIRIEHNSNSKAFERSVEKKKETIVWAKIAQLFLIYLLDKTIKYYRTLNLKPFAPASLRTPDLTCFKYMCQITIFLTIFRRLLLNGRQFMWFMCRKMHKMRKKLFFFFFFFSFFTMNIQSNLWKLTHVLMHNLSFYFWKIRLKKWHLVKKRCKISFWNEMKWNEQNKKRIDFFFQIFNRLNYDPSRNNGHAHMWFLHTLQALCTPYPRSLDFVHKDLLGKYAYCPLFSQNANDGGSLRHMNFNCWIAFSKIANTRSQIHNLLFCFVWFGLLNLKFIIFIFLGFRWFQRKRNPNHKMHEYRTCVVWFLYSDYDNPLTVQYSLALHMRKY